MHSGKARPALSCCASSAFSARVRWPRHGFILSCFANSEYGLSWALRHERNRNFIEIVTLFHLGFVAFILVLVIRTLFPSGEKLHCDHSKLVISRIPWINFRGQWITRVFSISQVSQFEYGVLQRGGGRSPAVYGILFLDGDKPQKALSRIEPPEASHLLRGLKRLGVDVLHDSDMLAKIKETLGDRREEI
jgi:hypothetical protein